MEINVPANTKILDGDKSFSLAVQFAKKKRLTIVDSDEEICYKKVYFIKILSFASRYPFKPKRKGYVLYYDSMFGQGGLTQIVPETKTIDIDESRAFDDVYGLEKLNAEMEKLIEKFIYKRYMLKRPEIKMVGVEEIYLPYYVYYAKEGIVNDIFLLNAITGQANI